MELHSDRRLEELSVGMYVLLALLSGFIAVGILSIDAPYVGAFFAFWLFVLCSLAAVATALVVLVVNVRRALDNADVDLPAVAFAAAILTSLTAVLAVVFAAPSPRVTETVLVVAGLVALVVAPFGLFVTLFGGRVRRRWRASAR